MQKIKKIHLIEPEENALKMDGLTDRWTDEHDFVGPLPQRWRFDVFQKFENKVFLNYLAYCEPYGNSQYKKRNTINVIQCSKS